MTQYPTQDVRLQVSLLIEKVKKHQQSSGFCPHDESISTVTFGGCFCVLWYVGLVYFSVQLSCLIQRNKTPVALF